MWKNPSAEPPATSGTSAMCSVCPDSASAQTLFFTALLIYLGWAHSIWGASTMANWWRDKEIPVLGRFAEGKKKSFTFSHNGSAVLTKDWEKNKEPCDSFFYVPFFPLHSFFFCVCSKLLSLSFSWDRSKLQAAFSFPAAGLGTQIRACLIRKGKERGRLELRE